MVREKGVAREKTQWWIMNKNTTITKQSTTRPATEQSCPNPRVQGLGRTLA